MICFINDDIEGTKKTYFYLVSGWTFRVPDENLQK